MKPFITDARKDGRCTLPLQLEGIERERLGDVLLGSSVVAYALPEGHSLESAWQCRFLLEKGGTFEFSSACTVVAGWQEVGSLNVKHILQGEDLNERLFIEVKVERFHITAVECLVYEAQEVYSECGIVLRDATGRELIVAAGVSPGSVSIKAPFSKEPFSPEFVLGDYRRVEL